MFTAASGAIGMAQVYRSLWRDGDVGDDDDDDIAHHIGPIPRPKAPPTAAQFVAYNTEMRRWWEEEQQRMGRRWQEEDELAAPLPAEGYAAATYWRVGNPTGEEEEVDEELAWHAVIGTAADAAYGAMALRLDVQQVLRQAKLPHVSWHTILSNHVCHSVNACKAFQRFREQHHEVHHCRLVLPNSYAPDDGIVVSAEAAAPTKHEASEYACMAVFVLLCADRGGGRSSVLFCPAHWNVPMEALLDDIRRIVDPHAKYQPLAVNQRAAGFAGVTEMMRGPDLERAAELTRLCLRAHGGSFDPCQIWGVYAIQLADVLPHAAIFWGFIEQHPEFDTYEEEGRWYIKWRSAAQDTATEASAPTAFAPAASASAASGALSAPAPLKEWAQWRAEHPVRANGGAPPNREHNDSSLTAAASDAPSASSSGAPSFVRDFSDLGPE